MVINKTIIFRFIKSLEISNHYKIDDLLYLLLSQQGINGIEQLKIFDNEKLKFIGFINEYISEFTNSNLIQKFILIGDKHLIGVLNNKSIILNDEQKERYKYRDSLITKINMEISPLLFEEFCSFILSDIYDFTLSNTTRGSKDGGIDFFGKYKIKNEPVNLFKSHPVYLYGQAKKYTNPVGESDIKEFSATRKNIIEGLDLRVKDKIPKDFTENPFLNLLFFITTSYFTSGAKYVANIHNIILKDINSIVDDIILKGSEKIYIKTSDGYEINFDFLKNT